MAFDPTAIKRQSEEVSDYLSSLNSWINSIKKEDEKLEKTSKELQSPDSLELLQVSDENCWKAEKLKEEGNICYKEGKLNDAVRKYTEGISLNPFNASLPANRAMALLLLQKYEEAQSDCTAALKLNPNYTKAYLRRGVARFNLGLRVAAVEDYQKVLELEPDNKEAMQELQSLQQSAIEDEHEHKPQKKLSVFKMKSLEKAVSKQTQGIASEPSNPYFYIERAQTFLKLQRYEDALVDCTNALNLDSAYVKAYIRRGLASLELGHISDARKDYTKALELDPGDKGARKELDELELNLKNWKFKEDDSTASTVAKSQVAISKPVIHGEISEKDPKLSFFEQDLENKVVMAECHQNGSESETKLSKENSFDDDCKHSELLKEEGNQLYKNGKIAEAIDKYSQSMVLNISNAVIPANRAMAYLKLEKFEEARKDCSLALELDPSYVKAYLRRANAHEKLGLRINAFEDYQKVLQFVPCNKLAKKELEAIKTKMNAKPIREEKTQEPVKSKVEKEIPMVQKVSPAAQKTSNLSLKRSEKLKEEGNSYFKEGNIKQAIAKYTQSMGLDPLNAQLPANRALAYIKLEKYNAARMDCTKALKLDPSYIKAYLRRAKASVNLGLITDAIMDYEKVLELEPWNEETREELELLKLELASQEVETVKEDDSKTNCSTVQMKDAPAGDKPSDGGVCSSEDLVVLPVKKSLRERSQKPLISIKIEDVFEESDICLNDRLKVISDPQSTLDQNTKINQITKKNEAKLSSSEISDTNIGKTALEQRPTIPRTSNQFANSWTKVEHSSSLSASYLKSIPLSFLKTAEIEVDQLTGIVRVLNSSEFCLKSAADMFDALSNSPTFSLNLAFLDETQKIEFNHLLEKLERDEEAKSQIIKIKLQLDS